MEHFDVVIIGGGVAGSVCAKFLAQAGVSTLLAEKYRTPRHKACSGIQLGYFSKIIGEKFPADKLCDHQLRKVYIQYPDGSSIKVPFPMFNFMRDVFDDYLNQTAKGYGAEFRDACEYTGFEETAEGHIVDLTRAGTTEKISCSYLVDASGLRPVIRRALRPGDFRKSSSAGTINYYIEGEGNLNPEYLYQFWNLEWNNQMFAWVYNKTLDGRNLWVVGSGYDKEPKEHCEAFLNYIRNKYDLRGKIVKTEGYASNIEFDSTERVWLGQGRILMIGDAAGLVDLARGVGMDSAALSGRLAAKAIIAAVREKKNALEEYSKYARRMTAQTKRNQGKSIHRFSTNDELLEYTKKGMKPVAVMMVVNAFLNRFRKPENLVLLP